MDSDDGTQATQDVPLDPIQVAKQNSGFSDKDMSDIICVLLPISENTRTQIRNISAKSSLHIIRRDSADKVKWDYGLENDVAVVPVDMGERAVVLRLSSKVKEPLLGFQFGRNRSRCDVCFEYDPYRRLSNVHFRIYFNEHGVLMIEDQSTNGTIVDDRLLKARTKQPHPFRRTLTAGSTIKILMHKDDLDLHFLVRIPHREGDHEDNYQRNLARYMANLNHLMKNDLDATIVPGPEGHVDLFPAAQATRPAARPALENYTIQESSGAPVRGVPRVWTGSPNYNRIGEIGKGAFATVYKVTSKLDGRPFAAKELDKRKFMKNGVLDQKVENEMKIMQRVRHPNIVGYIEHIDWDNRLLIIIMEYVPGGDLGKLVAYGGRLAEHAAVTLAKQLLGALGYLHENNITHRDVKPDNILISSQQPFVVKLTDFGLSKMIDTEETFLRTFCGTLLYCAPEVYSEYREYDDNGRRHPRNRQRYQPTGQRYDHAVDIWSLGGVLFYALTKLPPFPVRPGTSYTELLYQIMTSPLDVTPLQEFGVSDCGIDFLSRMLNRRPENRATVQELLQHPWLGGSGVQQSSPPPLPPPHPSQELENLSLEDKENQNYLPRAADLEVDDGLSDDEIVDEILDEKENDESLLEANQYESEKENYTFGPGQHLQARLFGEVNVSAIGSSGVIPSARLNLPVSNASLGSTEVLETSQRSEVGDSFESDSSAPRQAAQKVQPSGGEGLRISVLSSQRNTVEVPNTDSSQSLEGTQSFFDNFMKSRGESHLQPGASDLGKSKRRKSYGTSDEFDCSSTRDRPSVKRLRSEVIDDSNTDYSSDDGGDLELYAHIPPIARSASGRQFDQPVNKAAYWLAEDKRSWHLDYPEMTQLQLEAFEAAASARGEKFGPRSALWDLAFRYFPPEHYHEKELASSTRVSTAQDGTKDLSHSSGIPGTAQPDTASQGSEAESNSLVDTQPPADVGLGLIVPEMDPDNRIVACFESATESQVKDISVLVTEALVTWGRGPDNTQVYERKMEAKVPKYGFRLVLWRERFAPWKDLRPWLHGKYRDEHAFHFYISTKATSGVWVNGTHLASEDCKNPKSAAKRWMRLHDGDKVDVWVDKPSNPTIKTQLVFRCNWGGSATRASSGSRPELVPEDVAKALDEACHRVDRKLPDLLEHAQKMEDAAADANERKLRKVDRERERSRLFEIRRAEAHRILALRNRRSVSTSSARPTALRKRTWVTELAPDMTADPLIIRREPTGIIASERTRRASWAVLP